MPLLHDENLKKLDKNIEDVHYDKTTSASFIKPKSNLYYYNSLVSAQRLLMTQCMNSTVRNMSACQVDTHLSAHSHFVYYLAQKGKCRHLVMPENTLKKAPKKIIQAQAASPRIWCRSLWK